MAPDTADGFYTHDDNTSPSLEYARDRAGGDPPLAERESTAGAKREATGPDPDREDERRSAAQHIKYVNINGLA